ncbi:putative membrane protein YesL [Okibacterium sp. HSC-33S16]|uniref:DUF624 domain-containing protein n=1 Tax=Okibacterium sp. HSC-33S16 TaxID=2910965 RepID=UPI00209FEE38|nr:DUF624 domain-containing protein [Okibacterium sp. HSC-33S16]MCP2032005.1 putative membrane protein YesL [Okibacterium sp. HSC-33S16]
MSRRSADVAARAARADGSAARWPGAAGAFALFGEVLWVGVLVTVSGIFVLTLPAALAAGSGHLRRYLAAEEASVRIFFRDLKKAFVGSLAIGAIAVAAVLLLTLDLALSLSGLLPGSQLVFIAGLIGLVLVGLVLVRSAALWRAEAGWPTALRETLPSLGADLVGALYLVVALGLAVLLTWQLAPLVIAGVGCLVFASVVVLERKRARDEARAALDV